MYHEDYDRLAFPSSSSRLNQSGGPMRIAVAAYVNADAVVVSFDRSATWIGLTPTQAKRLAAEIVRAADLCAGADGEEGLFVFRE